MTKTTTSTDMNVILNDGSTSKSYKMRALYNEGVAIGDIAKAMNVRYNFVYNVVSNACRMEGIEIRTARSGDTRKDQIVALLKEGKAPAEISKELRANINMVYKYRKEMEAGLIA